VVRTALALAHQPDLVPTTVERVSAKGERLAIPSFHLPRLTHGWARATEGLTHPVTGNVRPITFDHAVAAGQDDVVLAHLGHRLVQQALWLLRSEIWAAETDTRLTRVAARIIPDGIIDQVAVIAHGRLVVTGGDGGRLHEEVIAAGGLVRNGRFSRLTSLGQVQAVVAAPSLGVPPIEVSQRMVEVWPVVVDGLLTALARRQQERFESLASVLAKRAQGDAAAVVAVLSELERSIRAELARVQEEYQPVLPGFSPGERAQFNWDLDALNRRLEAIPGEIESERAAVGRRYADPKPRLFPAAVELCVPERLGGHR
jgi:hypothetical protein